MPETIYFCPKCGSDRVAGLTSSALGPLNAYPRTPEGKAVATVTAAELKSDNAQAAKDANYFGWCAACNETFPTVFDLDDLKDAAKSDKVLKATIS